MRAGFWKENYKWGDKEMRGDRGGISGRGEGGERKVGGEELESIVKEENGKIRTMEGRARRRK